MNNEKSPMPYQVSNPTKRERHDLLKQFLLSANRMEDYNNILELLSPTQDILNTNPKLLGKNINIAVIGAGEAGLAAAFELKKLGCNITIYEASERIGGRVLTHYFNREYNHFGELGAMRVPVSHETTWHYIDLFNLETHPFATKTINNYFYLRNTRARNDPEGYSVMENIYPRFNLPPDEQNIPWNSLSERMLDTYFNSLPPEIKKELIEIKPIYSDEIALIDNINLRRAYENVLLSQNAISMIGSLSTFERSFFNLSLMEIMQETYSADFVNTYYIKNGMSTLPHSFYNALINKNREVYSNIGVNELGRVDFNFSTAVDGMFHSSNGNKVVLECRDTKIDSISYNCFDYIVCAIPFSSLRRVKIEPLFSVQKMQGIMEINYAPAQKTHFYLKERFWELEPHFICAGSSSTDLPNTSVFYPSDHAIPVPDMPGTWVCDNNTSPFEPGVLQASYNLLQEAQILGNEQAALRIEDIKNYVEAIHDLPQKYIDNNLLAWTSILWSKVQYIWGIGNLANPGEKLHFSYINSLPEFNNRLFFAGEHISQKHAWQQGALQTGMIAASKIADSIKARKA